MYHALDGTAPIFEHLPAAQSITFTLRTSSIRMELDRVNVQLDIAWGHAPWCSWDGIGWLRMMAPCPLLVAAWLINTMSMAYFSET